ncbi:hypothetical protein C6N01_12885 [Enterococcus faecalis]|uniref:hypothetical protein n=1 Tax=Enterococcus faecalis TaxID=1351 RepID=UPI001363163F|nr:hypothetical protein [Enterococcus faecalis]NBJ47109.1 hypothetical protein [Enterococcus faecalis]
MIFCIGDDLLKSIENQDDIIDYEALSDQLLGVIQSNNNMLMVSSNLIFNVGPTIIRNRKYNRKLRKIVNHCMKVFPQQYHIVKNTKYKIILTINRTEQDENNIFLGWDYIVQNEIELQKRITLLSEDISDCEFYENLSKYYFLNATNSGISIFYRRDAGAGQNIAKALENAVTHSQEIVLAICDSDFTLTKRTLGDTARFLINKANELKDSEVCHYKYHILEVSEKENLILPSEYIKFLNNDFLHTLIELEKVRDKQEILKFIDLKKGITKAQYLKNQEYYEELFDKIPKLRNLRDIDSIENDKDSITHSLGRTCLKNFSMEYLTLDAGSYLHESRKNIAELVYSFGLSIKRTHIA